MQDSKSISTVGVLRGLHMQIRHPQEKPSTEKNSFREYVCNADQQRANPVRALLRRYLALVANEELRMEVFGF